MPKLNKQGQIKQPDEKQKKENTKTVITPLGINVKPAEELTSCIRYTSGRALWRANPDDPYLYISFSTDQLQQTYGKDMPVKALFQLAKPIMITQEVINRLKALINEEWIERAELPIKYLPNDATNIQNKNVCFIIMKGMSPQESLVANGKMIRSQSTHHLRFPEKLGDNVTPAQYKTIILNQITLETMTNEYLYMFLHEFAHAMEAKHFRSYGEKVDMPPYCRGKQMEEDVLDCTRTVVAYKEDCPPVVQKDIELFGFNSVSIFDPNPEVQKKVKEVASAYPAKLGDVDLAAAKQFNEDWQQRNLKAKQLAKSSKSKVNTAKNKQKATSSVNSQPHVHVDLIVTQTTVGGLVETLNKSMPILIQEGMERIAKWTADFFLNLGQSLEACDHYFPKLPLDAPSHYSTQHLQFFNTAVANRMNSSNTTTEIMCPSDVLMETAGVMIIPSLPQLT